MVLVFRRLFAASYPIEEMRLPTTADLDAAPTGDGNNTAAYVCRSTRGSSTLSAHAYGLAVDVQPVRQPLLAPATWCCRSWPAPTWTGPGAVPG